MKKIIKTLKTLRGKLAVIAVIGTAFFAVRTLTDDSLSTEQALSAILAVAFICLTTAVICWVTGWKFANTPLSVKWAKWDGKHELPNQQKRMRQAIQPMFDVVTLDRDYGNAKYNDVSTSGVYHTNLFNCTCIDYQTRHLPCRHMYALAGELGLIDIYQALPKKKAEVSAENASEETEA
ncbi:MAG: SWIM zinc finger family protein [Oscillospiraceae bacterium]|nr:SWIM zinc finger family protein [Oscillospiraceae bacterium]